MVDRVGQSADSKAKQVGWFWGQTGSGGKSRFRYNAWEEKTYSGRELEGLCHSLKGIGSTLKFTRHRKFQRPPSVGRFLASSSACCRDSLETTTLRRVFKRCCFYYNAHDVFRNFEHGQRSCDEGVFPPLQDDHLRKNEREEIRVWTFKCWRKKQKWWTFLSKMCEARYFISKRKTDNWKNCTAPAEK